MFLVIASMVRASHPLKVGGVNNHIFDFATDSATADLLQVMALMCHHSKCAALLTEVLCPLSKVAATILICAGIEMLRMIVHLLITYQINCHNFLGIILSSKPDGTGVLS